jgi:hypothetical protein
MKTHRRFDIIRSIAIGLVCVLCIPLAYCEQVEDWPYEKLLKHADIVVIAQPISVRPADSKIQMPRGLDKAGYYSVVTHFKILAMVKGVYKGEQLGITHFQVKEGAKPVDNGPVLVYFQRTRKQVKNESSDVRKKDYVLFLKKDKAGHPTFVSGQIYPGFSVKVLLDAEP